MRDVAPEWDAVERLHYLETTAYLRRKLVMGHPLTVDDVNGLIGLLDQMDDWIELVAAADAVEEFVETHGLRTTDIPYVSRDDMNNPDDIRVN